MKRLRIWLNSFTLIQQYILMSSMALVVFLTFTLQFVNTKVDNFTNQQMYSYLHRSQNLYIDAIGSESAFDDSNVRHYIYDVSSGNYLEEIPEDLKDIMIQINPMIDGDIADLFMSVDNENIAYSIKRFGKNFLVSIVNDEYRNEFKQALISSTVNSLVIMITILIALIMLWVYSLISPLNAIRNYIFKLKNGEQGKLYIKRNDEIGEVAEAVISMNDELAKQQRIREEMIQNISHDLKTPIATIKSYSESIKDGVYPYDTLEKSVDVIIEHAERLEKKVYSLITYNKIGYLEDSKPGDNLLMSSVIEKAILSCQVLRNDVVIDTDNVEYGIYFHGEEEAWRTVVENLLDNGLRYAKSKVSILLTDNLLEVYNDGELMEKDRLDKLFKPYEKGTKGNFGLGLSIVKRVCDTYGYNVIGENKSDGVVFRIYRNKPKEKKKV